MPPPPWWSPKHPQRPKQLPQPRPPKPNPKRPLQLKKASLVGSKACSVAATQHPSQPPPRKNRVRKKTNDAKAVAHAAKVALKAEAKVVAEVVVVAEAASVQNAAKVVVNAPSAARLAQVSAKTVTVNARRTEQSVVANAKTATASAQNAVKAVVHVKTATEALVKPQTVKATAQRKRKLALKPAPKRKPRCVPKRATSAWPVKNAAANPMAMAKHLVAKVAASAAPVERIAVANVLRVKRSQPMCNTHCL